MTAWRWLVVVVGFLVSALAVRADDWPQWRGRHRDGISAETGLLKEWPKEGPKLVWQLKDVGGGYSTPSVAGGNLFLMGDLESEEFVRAYDTGEGKLVWEAAVGKVGKNRGPQYPGTRSTPTVDGDFIYALGSDGDLVCFDASGKPRWKKNLRDDFGGEMGRWAYSESPLVDGDIVVCTPGGKDATLIALNKQSGDVIWKSAVPGGDEAAYASVIAVDVGGFKQYVQFLQNGLVGVDAKTGKFLWRYDKTAKGSPANIPTPIAHDGYVYSAAGKSGGGLVKLAVMDGSVDAKQIYFTPRVPTSIGGAVEVNGYLYGTNSQGLLCADFKTGEIKWQNRCVGAGSVCYADGRLYVHGEKPGAVALVEATPEGYREKGRFSPPSPPAHRDEKAWAYPVVANGRLYIRDLGSLWSFDVKASAQK
jgi:outer membrane protein assembly factor BamB